MAGKSAQSSHLSPHSRHLSTLIRISGKSMSGMGVGEGFKTTTTKPLRTADKLEDSVITEFQCSTYM